MSIDHVLNTMAEVERDLLQLAKGITSTQAVARSCADRLAHARLGFIQESQPKPSEQSLGEGGNDGQRPTAP